jgi:hypothetical protein
MKINEHNNENNENIAGNFSNNPQSPEVYNEEGEWEDWNEEIFFEGTPISLPQNIANEELMSQNSQEKDLRYWENYSRNILEAVASYHFNFTFDPACSQCNNEYDETLSCKECSIKNLCLSCYSVI